MFVCLVSFDLMAQIYDFFPNIQTLVWAERGESKEIIVRAEIITLTYPALPESSLFHLLSLK